MELMVFARPGIYINDILGIFYNGFIGTHLIVVVGAIAGFLIFNLGIIGRKGGFRGSWFKSAWFLTHIYDCCFSGIKV